MNLLDPAHLENDTAYHRRVDEQLQQLHADPMRALSMELCAAAFARYFLGHVCRKPFSQMHHVSFRRYDELARAVTDPLERTGRRLALAAPRGSAKSSLHTLMLPLMDICLARERYIVIISATAAQACIRLKNIRRELLSNEKLRDTFGDRLKPERPWTRSSIAVNGVRVDAFSALSEIRGIAHGEARPTRIILDDAESSRRAQSPAGRQNVQEWYDEVIENLGDTYTHLEVVGTILHRESLLSKLLTRPGFDSQLYRSIVNWAENAELWCEWQRLYVNAADPAREETAAAFYEANEAKMMEGTQVMWPERETYLDLMKQLTTRGNAAFQKEKQNAPVSGSDMGFKLDAWKWFTQRVNGQLVAQPGPLHADQPAPASDEVLGDIKDLTVYGYLDPATGKCFKRGDYAAIATIGRSREGVYFLLHLWLGRVPAHVQAEKAFELHQRFNYQRFWYEANGYQSEALEKPLAEARQKARVDGKRFDLAWAPVLQSTNKNDRIFRIEKPVGSNTMFFYTDAPPEMIAEAEDFPFGKHDDALDAIASCIIQVEEHCPLHRPPTVRKTAKAIDSFNAYVRL